MTDAALDLMVPVYLNQRMVFDLVATLRGGIATVSTVAESAKGENARKFDVSGTFGLSQVLASLFKTDLSGSAESGTKSESEKNTSEERVHTPTSLFSQLRAMIMAKQALTLDSHDIQPKPGDLLEFRSALSKNPILETIEALIDMQELQLLFGQWRPPETAKARKPKDDSTRRTKAQMEEFKRLLVSGHTVDLVTGDLLCGYRAVLVVDLEYLSDPADLVDGTFRILGKVVGAIDKGNGAVSMMRRSALRRFPLGPLRGAFPKFKEMGNQMNIELPEPEWEIPGPVVQVLPIAIFA